MDGESINSHVMCFSSTADSQWVAQNLQEVNQTVDFMLEIIEKSDTSHQKRLELTSLINGINQKHQLLGQKFEEQTISASKLQDQLELHEKEMGLLKANLNSEKNRAFELQEKITRYADDELKIQFLENEIKKCEALKGEMKDLYQAQEMHWHNKEECLKAELNEKNRKFEALNNNFDGLKLKFDMLMSENDGLNAKIRTINADNMIQQAECLKTELNEKNKNIEALNKNFDGLKLKFDMLMSEKDGLNAKLQTLNAELCSKDNMIQQTECLKTELNGKGRKFEALNKNLDGLKLKFDMLMSENDGLNAKIRTLNAELCSKDIIIQQAECLKIELNEENRNLEALNKNFDGLKLKFDMLISEKDTLNTKLQTLNAELCSKDNIIQQTESRLHQLHLQNLELNAPSGIVLKQKDELRLKVEELEREIKCQEVMLTDRAEEKREAIRQLCYSLEHYRNGYQQLRKVYTGQWRHAVPSS